MKPEKIELRKTIIKMLTEGKNYKDIAQQTSLSAIQVYTIKRLLDSGKISDQQPFPLKTKTAKTEGTEQQQKEATAEQEIKIETPEQITPITPIATDVKIQATTEIKQALTSGSIEAIFKSINCMLPKKYQRDDDSIKLLGEVWTNPLNRMMSKYVDDNADLYIAVVVTIMVFIPVPLQYLQDRPKKPIIQDEFGKQLSGK